jgi:hypothetical protein
VQLEAAVQHRPRVLVTGGPAPGHIRKPDLVEPQAQATHKEGAEATTRITPRRHHFTLSSKDRPQIERTGAEVLDELQERARALVVAALTWVEHQNDDAQRTLPVSRTDGSGLCDVNEGRRDLTPKEALPARYCFANQLLELVTRVRHRVSGSRPTLTRGRPQQSSGSTG